MSQKYNSTRKLKGRSTCSLTSSLVLLLTRLMFKILVSRCIYGQDRKFKLWNNAPSCLRDMFFIHWESNKLANNCK